MSRRIQNTTFVGLGLLVFLFTMFGPNGVVHLQALRAELGALERSVEKLDGKAAFYNRKIDRLQDEPSALERVAREQLGLSREGEIIYIFSNSRRDRGDVEDEALLPPRPGG